MATPVDAGSIYSDVRIRLDRLNADIKSVQTSFDKLGTGVQDQNKKTEKSFNSMGLAGTAAIGAVTLAFKKSLSVFAATEQSLANVAAVSNATAKEFKALEDAANEAGTTTRFTASQAADALFFLSSAGLSATESVDALNGVLELAGATGSDLAQSAQTVTATLSQFSLEAEDASRVSNVFAAANANSQATLEKLQSALRQVGPVAGQLGISLEEVTGSLQALFNAGFKGETAGVALRNALADLANESSTAVQKLEALGISAESVNPEIVGLTGAIGTLEAAGLSTADALDVFGKEAGPALLSLLKVGADGLRDYEQAVTDTDEAARQYAVQNDTLAGSFDALKSATEGASNELVKQLAPILRGIIDLAAGFLRVVAGLPDILKGAGTGAAVAAGGFIALSKALALVGVTLSSGPLAIVAGIGALVVGMSSLIARSRELKQEKLAEEFGGIADELGKSGSEVDEFLEKAELIEGALVRGFGQTFEQSNEQVKALAENLEVTKEEVIKIGLASDNVLQSQKDQLRAIQDQIVEQRISAELASTREVIEEKALEREYEKARALAEQQRIQQEQEALEAKRQERLDRIAAVRERLQTLDELAVRGAISEVDLLEEKKALREEEIELLLSQALESGEVTDQLLSDIEKQKASIAGYEERLKNLTETTKEETEEQADEFESLNARRLALEDEWFTRYVKGSDDRLTVLRFERDQALAEAEELGASTLAIQEYYAREEEKLVRSTEEEKRKIEEAALQDRLQQNITYSTQVLGIAENFLSALSSLYTAQASAETDAINERLEAQLEAIDAEGLAEEDADAKKAAATEKAEAEIAKIEYESALQSWELSRLQAIVGAANAIIQGYAQLGPIGGSIAAVGTAAVTALQLAAINAAKPTPPNAATGGLVLPSPGGTLVNTAENGSPELLLNGGGSGQALLGQFAEQIAARIGGGSGQLIRIDNRIILDGDVVARSVVDKRINKGRFPVDRSRGLRG